MKAPIDRRAAAVGKFIRRKSGSDGKSVFGLLLLIEQKIGNRVRRNEQLRVAIRDALKLIGQRRPGMFKLSRYVE